MRHVEEARKRKGLRYTGPMGGAPLHQKRAAFQQYYPSFGAILPMLALAVLLFCCIELSFKDVVGACLIYAIIS